MARSSYHNPSSCLAGFLLIIMVFHPKKRLFEELAPGVYISVALVPIEYEPVRSNVIGVEEEIFRSRDDPTIHPFARPTSCARVSSDLRARILWVAKSHSAPDSIPPGCCPVTALFNDSHCHPKGESQVHRIRELPLGIEYGRTLLRTSPQ